MKNFIEIINNSALFDKEWYYITYPDVRISGIPAAEHYLKFGGHLKRDPSPHFSSAAYYEAYPDVAKEKMNPLLHFEKYGRAEGKINPKEPSLTERIQIGRVCVDVVVPVYNALEDVKACLHSLASCENSYDLRVLVINDGSDAETTKWLRHACGELCNNRTTYELIEHEGNKGYTKAVNTGLRASDALYVITQNSDTILTPFWVDGLVRCMESDPKLGIVGPLSNAASWQNVPVLHAPDGGFAINALPEDVTPADMADIARQVSRRTYPRTPFVNGFCFMIRRAVIDAIGYMDEVAFPTGYGEENDFCIRAQDAGFTLAYADDTYVFHAKSKSFGTERRLALSKAGSKAIRAKHTAEKFNMLVDVVKKTAQMDAIRARVQHQMSRNSGSVTATSTEWVMKQKILFLLPVNSGGSGGAHSVVQEVTAMRNMGVEAKIAVREKNLPGFHTLYGDIPDVESLFLGFSDATLVSAASHFDVVIATISTSVSMVRDVISNCPWIVPAYYAQDYEPLFFTEDTEQHQIAFNSYNLIPEALIFAKTHWICKQIKTHHNAQVIKVEPSIDHSIYFPSRTLKQSDVIVISAMIRPRTPRRGAARTMELLHLLKDKFGNKISIKIFGADANAPDYLALPRDFEFKSLGVLTRPQVADLLREADVFIDLSDYQAFGRTGLEAMSCGTLSVVPKAGGGDEYAIDGVNALVVDSMDVHACFTRLIKTLDDPEQITRLQMAAIQTAAAYSPRRAAMSELLAFAPAVAALRAKMNPEYRPNVCLIPAKTTPTSSVTGSGYVRMICPYTQAALIKDWDILLNVNSTLPTPGTFDIVMIQRDLTGDARAEFKQWHKAWHQKGGKIIYEIDDDLLDGAALSARGYPGDTTALAQRVRLYAATADVITVSTKHLASVFSDHKDKLRIVPNFIDDTLWSLDTFHSNPDRELKKKIKLGYVGTPTHDEDLKIVTDAIHIVQKNYDIDVEVIGAFQNSPPLFGNRIGLPKKNIYPAFVNWLGIVAHWDISIIPLQNNSFNRSKSNLKFLECGALGTAIVCSDNAEYRQVARHEENCLLTKNTTNAWITAISRLIENPELRHRLAVQAHSDIATRLTVQKNTNLYTSVLEQAMNKGKE